MLYQMSGRLSTTGWDNQFDVNQQNDFGMTPAQVATQAGNVIEFEAITQNAKFDPNKMGSLQVFFEICKRDSEDAFRQFQAYFREVFCQTFEFQSDRRTWARKN